MKKICIFFLMLSFTALFTSGCKVNMQNSNMVHAKRRFAQYVEPPKTNSVSRNIIDLSEGPKTDYDRKLGPQNPNFDFRIVDPY